jgi:hypothetical protein
VAESEAPEGADEGSATSQQQTLTSLVAPVSEVLSSSRREVFDLAAQRVMELVGVPGLLKGEDFPQVSQ